MNARLDKILELLNQPTQHSDEDAPGDWSDIGAEEWAEATRQLGIASGEAAEGLRRLADSFRALAQHIDTLDPERITD